jgi:hypothetical protein
VALLVTGVLGDKMQVLAADNDGTVHLGRDDGAGQDTATDRNVTSERALLVCMRPLIRAPLQAPRLSSSRDRLRESVSGADPDSQPVGRNSIGARCADILDIPMY